MYVYNIMCVSLSLSLSIYIYIYMLTIHHSISFNYQTVQFVHELFQFYQLASGAIVHQFKHFGPLNHDGRFPTLTFREFRSRVWANLGGGP